MKYKKPKGWYDVQENRDGYLSKDQIKLLGTRRIVMCIYAHLVSNFFLFFPAVLALGIFPANLLLIICSVQVIAGCFSLRQWLLYSFEISEKKAGIFTGSIELKFDKMYDKFLLQAGPKTLQISAETLISLRNGEFYNVYFTPRTNLYLWCEPVLSSAPIGLDKLKRDGTVKLGDDGELINTEGSPKQNPDTKLKIRLK
jgi:hypothetical protein